MYINNNGIFKVQYSSALNGILLDEYNIDLCHFFAKHLIKLTVVPGK